MSFVGMAGGMEERLVAERGLPFHGLPAKPLVGRGLPGKVKALTTLAGSNLTARDLIRKLGADVVLGTGGKASGSTFARCVARNSRTFASASRAAGSLYSSQWPKELRPGCTIAKLKP